MDLINVPEQVFNEKYLKYKQKYISLSQDGGKQKLTAEQTAQIKEKQISLRAEYGKGYEKFLGTLKEKTDGLTEEQLTEVATSLVEVLGTHGPSRARDAGDVEFTQSIGNPNKVTDGLIIPNINKLTDPYLNLYNLIQISIGPNGKKIKTKTVRGVNTKGTSIELIADDILNHKIREIGNRSWGKYPSKKGTPKDIQQLMKSQNIDTINLLNEQKDLDSECEEAGIAKGFQYCKDDEPNYLAERSEREAKFKEKVEIFREKLVEAEELYKEEEAEFNETQQAFNEARDARQALLQKRYDETQSKAPTHKQDDTLTALTNHKNAIMQKKVEKICAEMNIPLKGKACTERNILQQFKKEFTRPNDVNVEFFNNLLTKN